MRLEEALEKHGGHESLTAYERGWVDGVLAYAWHKDGTLQVGTTGTLVGDAIDKFLAERSTAKRAILRHGGGEV